MRIEFFMKGQAGSGGARTANAPVVGTGDLAFEDRIEDHTIVSGLEIECCMFLVVWRNCQGMNTLPKAVTVLSIASDEIWRWVTARNL